jgi:hypothetical protein
MEFHMPRKTATGTAAPKTGARVTSSAAKAKAPKAATARATPAKPAAAKSAAPARARTGLKTAVKAAAKAIAAPPAKKAAHKAPARAEREHAEEARPLLVRDSFTMPEHEYAVLAEVKQACLRAGIDVKKSELLRIGVALLGQLDLSTLKSVLAALPQLKTGRPPAQS